MQDPQTSSAPKNTFAPFGGAPPEGTPPRLPILVRFMLLHAVIGFVIAVVFVGALMVSDAAGLRTLMMASDSGYVAIFMLVFVSGLTFGGAQMGVAVMLLGEEYDPTDHPGDSPDGKAASGLVRRIFNAPLYGSQNHIAEDKGPA